MSGHGTVPTLVITGAHPKLFNEDRAPTASDGWTSGVFSLFAMWMFDVQSVGGYTFAASLFFFRLTDWQVLVSMICGIGMVHFLVNLIGRPSQKYAIPYPVVARISFGIMGANLAALIRGVVGIIWYGVQATAAIALMASATMLIVADFSAPLLNVGDFAQSGKSDKAIRQGNFLGLPVNFLVLSIITVIVAAGTMKVFGEAIIDPALIVEKIGNPFVVIVGSITIIVATMGINIVTNFARSSIGFFQAT